EIQAGWYRLKIILAGFEEFSTGNFILNENRNFPDISLYEETQMLEEVVVRSKKSMMEAHAGKLVVHVENSMTSAGSTVLEALEQTPGISVDQNDQIRLKGKQKVTVMINGKAAPLQGADLVGLLKGMSAESVEKME